MKVVTVKRDSTFQNQNAYFFSTGIFWGELPILGDIGHRDVCFLFSIMKLDGTWLVAFDKLIRNVS